MQEQATDRLIKQLEQRILQLERDNSELASGHARLSAILDNEPECVKLLAADGSLLEMNPAGLRMIEADSLEEVRNHCVYPLIVEEHRAAFRCLNETALAGGSGVLEFEIVGLKGGRRWLETHASPLRDAAGAVTAMLGLTRDITRRKAAEALVAQQLSEMEQLYRTAPVGLALLDGDLRFVRINERLAAIDGRPVADHVGRTLEEVVPALSAELLKLYQGVLDTGSPVLDLEISGFTPAEPAVERHWLVNYLPVHDSDGLVAGVSAVVVDITERKLAESERADLLVREHAAKKQVDRILESVSDAFVALDKDWRYTYVNRRAGEIFQRRPDDLIGKHIWTEFPEGLGQPFHRAYEKAFAEQVPQTLEEYYPPYDTWFENRIYPHPEGVSIVFQDITSRKRSERELLESRGRLNEAQRIGQIGDWSLDLATGGCVLSPQAYALYEHDPALGAPSFDQFLVGLDADNRRIVEDNIARLLQSRQQQSYEFWAQLPSGKEVCYAVTALPNVDDSGQLTGVRGVVQDITERKQAEAAMRRSEQQLRNVMDGLGPHMFVGLLDTRGVVLMANRPARTVASLEEEDVIGRRVEDTYWWDYSPEVRQRIQEAVRRAGLGEAVRYDEQIRVAEGQFIWIDFSINPLYDDAGAVVSLVPSAIAITERKQAELLLHKSETQLRSILDGLGPHMLVGLTDLRGVVLMANRAVRAVASLKEKDIVGQRAEATYWFAYSPAVMSRLRDAGRRAAQGESVRYDERIRVAKGQFIWIDFSINPLYDDTGTVVALVPSAVEITERKQAEQALLARETQLGLIYENVADAVFLLEVKAGEFRFVSVNASFLAATGLGLSQVVGKWVGEVIPEPALSTVLEHYARAADSGQAVHWEEVSVYPSGTRHGEVTVAPVMDGDGRCTQLIGTVHDVTARMQARQQLSDAAVRQQALARRLVELQEAEQRHLSAELHDRIGQNLTALSINLNIIGSRKGPAHMEATAARLEDSRKLLETTIASVRDLITELRPPALDDYGLLAGLRWFGEQVHARTGLRISVLGEEPSPRLEPKIENALFRIAQEALTNIVKHAQAQRVGLTLQREAGTVTLSIADDGCGFDPPTLRRPGLRAHWGLEMMSERAEAVGARWRVESTPGQGTRIVVAVEIAP